jgi:putative ATP-dependent endonuclease of OLD family
MRDVANAEKRHVDNGAERTERSEMPTTRVPDDRRAQRDSFQPSACLSSRWPQQHADVVARGHDGGSHLGTSDADAEVLTRLHHRTVVKVADDDAIVICNDLAVDPLWPGSRALSLEHGSLLDIILRLKEIRPKMWEGTLEKLAGFDVASDPALGISGVLDSIDKSLKKYVPREWGAKPHLKVSSLTREHLRKVVTAFITTGAGDHAAPFFRQGTGTINMLVLAMLSQIAEDKQNVIFAMEEVETAIPPYAQKRIVHELRKLAAQSLFTSHSPYVLEEFMLDETVILSRSDDGKLTQAQIALPDSVKHKRYRQEFRTRFCEGLLSRRVLIAEGATEATSFPVAARRLSELNPAIYSSLEALGVCVIDAGSESQIADLASLYKSLGKLSLATEGKETRSVACLS